MTTSVAIVAMEPGSFGVQLQEAQGVETSHRVHVPEEFVGELGLPSDDESIERLVRETFLFLLEREPSTSILPEFSLPEVERFFPEFRDEIVARVGAG